VRGYRRIFAHTASVFFVRKIARPETGEISSLSCEECPGEEIIVTLFEIHSTPESRRAYVEREHEFRFLAVQCDDLHGNPCPTLAVSESAALQFEKMGEGLILPVCKSRNGRQQQADRE